MGHRGGNSAAACPVTPSLLLGCSCSPTSADTTLWAQGGAGRGHDATAAQGRLLKGCVTLVRSFWFYLQISPPGRGASLDGQAGCSQIDKGKQGADGSWAPPVHRTPAQVMRHSPWARREHPRRACVSHQHVLSTNQRQAEAVELVLGQVTRAQGSAGGRFPACSHPHSPALVCVLLRQRPASLMVGRVCRPA